MPDATPDARLRHHHALAVHTRIGALTLAVDLKLFANWTILFGPSGSGKSSLLRAAAGLLGRSGIQLICNPDEADAITLQDDTHFTPPHRRNIRWAPQHTSLFPHLSVRDNLTFSADATHTPLDPAVLDEIVTLFRLAPLINRRPASLSGGERQRVNLARAFASPHCELMLLDEPFTGFDRPLRDALLPQMREWLRARAIPVISVTHDIDEAFRLQAEVVRIHDGKVEAQGYVSKVLAEERARQLASL